MKGLDFTGEPLDDAYLCARHRRKQDPEPNCHHLRTDLRVSSAAECWQVRDSPEPDDRHVGPVVGADHLDTNDTSVEKTRYKRLPINRIHDMIVRQDHCPLGINIHDHPGTPTSFSISEFHDRRPHLLSD